MDGLSVEFYKVFLKELKRVFIKSVTFSKLPGYLPHMQYQGVITLIPKSGKDLLFTSKYRPFTLLNRVYKIISKVLNDRPQRLLQEVIGPEENGFTKSRYIGHNIQLLFNFIDFMDDKKLLGEVFSLDMCKAVDSLQ